MLATQHVAYARLGAEMVPGDTYCKGCGFPLPHTDGRLCITSWCEMGTK